MKRIAQGVDSDVYLSRDKKSVLKVYGDVYVKPLKAKHINEYAKLQNYVAQKGPIHLDLPKPIKLGNIEIRHINIQTLPLSGKSHRGESKKSGRRIYITRQPFVEGQTVEKLRATKEDKEILYTQISGEIGKHITYVFDDISGQNMKIESIESKNGGTLNIIITDIGGSIPALLQRNKDLIKELLAKKA